MDEQEPVVAQLLPNQVIGRTLKEIWQVCNLNTSGLDWVTTYFVLDSGISFCLPWEGADGLSGESIPSNAEKVSDSLLVTVIGQRITALLKALPESNVPSESLYLLLESGFLVSDVCGGWHGTGGVGVFVQRSDETDGKQFETLWE